jgi:hypothetical protein
MKPELPTPNLTPEQSPLLITPSIEKASGLDNPETGLDRETEAYEKKADLGAIRSDIGLTATPSLPIVGSITKADDTTISNYPVVANDDDLIEKEWVDKAKQIIADTHDDPYKRDQEVNKLQVDYLKKRFGRELGVAE